MKPRNWRRFLRPAWRQFVASRRFFAGLSDYLLRTAPGDPQIESFNGQPIRRTIVREILDIFSPVAIFETGTYRGSTTAYLAATHLPTYTVEADPYNFGYSTARLWRRGNVRMFFGDSRFALKSVLKSSPHFGGAAALYYLDAHWNADLPLAEELDIIFSRHPAAVVMIDDFQVEGDDGYGFDSYGPKHVLNKAYVQDNVVKHALSMFVPTASSTEEGGAKRGCAVLVKANIHGAMMSSVRGLRPA